MKKSNNSKKVRVTGVEPARSFEHKPLKPARLPIPPYALIIELKAKKLSVLLNFFCDRAGARTQDPLLKREMLYQLSYQVNFLIEMQIYYQSFKFEAKK